MKKAENLFIGIILITSIVLLLYFALHNSNTQDREIVANKYGSFLAAQHAVYVNDFAAASNFVTDLSDIDYVNVKNLRTLSKFLEGDLPENVSELKDEKSASAKIIYENDFLQLLEQKHL